MNGPYIPCLDGDWYIFFHSGRIGEFYRCTVSIELSFEYSSSVLNSSCFRRFLSRGKPGAHLIRSAHFSLAAVRVEIRKVKSASFDGSMSMMPSAPIPNRLWQSLIARLLKSVFRAEVHIVIMMKSLPVPDIFTKERQLPLIKNS
jgi:hypothetical protein